MDVDGPCVAEEMDEALPDEDDETLPDVEEEEEILEEMVEEMAEDTDNAEDVEDEAKRVEKATRNPGAHVGIFSGETT